MDGLIDYAGLFPPAELSLPDAIDNYCRYRGEADAWMLARFIIPVSQLSALTDYIDATGNDYFGSGAAYSIVGQGGQDGPSFLNRVDQDIQTVKQFRAQHGQSAVLDVYEVRLPGSEDAIKTAVGRASNMLLAEGLRPFFEVPPGDDWPGRAGVAIDAIRAYNSLQATSHGIGFKLRCGGLEVSAFPDTDRVSGIIIACRDAGVPLKATAGLHHPIRHYNDNLQTRVHGFINVFGAGVLTNVHGLEPQKVVAIIEEEAEGFSFSDEAFSWNDLSVTVEDITRIRQQCLISYGSCSFDEPREDLLALGWL